MKRSIKATSGILALTGDSVLHDPIIDKQRNEDLIKRAKKILEMGDNSTAYAIKNGTFDQGLNYMRSMQRHHTEGLKKLTDINLSSRAIRQLKRQGIITLNDLRNTSQNQRENMFWLSKKIREEINSYLIYK